MKKTYKVFVHDMWNDGTGWSSNDYQYACTVSIGEDATKEQIMRAMRKTGLLKKYHRYYVDDAHEYVIYIESASMDELIELNAI